MCSSPAMADPTCSGAQRRPSLAWAGRATPITGVLDSKVLLLVGEYGAILDNRAPVFSLYLTGRRPLPPHCAVIAAVRYAGSLRAARRRSAFTGARNSSARPCTLRSLPVLILQTGGFLDRSRPLRLFPLAPAARSRTPGPARALSRRRDRNRRGGPPRLRAARRCARP